LSDDFDELFDAPAPVAAPASAAASVAAPPPTSLASAPAPAPAPTPVAVRAPFLDPTTVWMPLLKPGSEVRFQDKPYTLGHVLLSKGDLFVNLKEMEGAIPAEKIRVRLTQIDLHKHLKIGHKS
jgi:hypothetical protein